MVAASQGRWVVVTGASAGLGAEFARVFAERGFDVVLTARREERLQTLAEEIERTWGRQTLVVVADLAEADAPQTIFDAVRDAGIHVDALVNNAGFGARGYFRQREWRDHAAFLQVMVTAVVHLTHLFEPGMVERGYGRIINVSSLAGLLPGVAGRTLYAPSKAFLVKFTEALAEEHEGDGVHCCAVCPGFTYTEFHDVLGNRAEVSRLPRLMWMDAGAVARESYEAVMRGQTLLVNGAPNKALATLVRLVPPGIAQRLLRGGWRRTDDGRTD